MGIISDVVPAIKAQEEFQLSGMQRVKFTRHEAQIMYGFVGFKTVKLLL